jgi:branched-chain amino acid transport system ATP-binding protein
LLELAEVSVARGGRTVVHEVSISVYAGEITVLLGANGAGKSTIVAAIAGLVPVRGGEILLSGRKISGLPPHRVRALGVAAVPEGHRVLAGLTVNESLRVAGRMLPRRRLAAGVASALQLFPELAERGNQDTASLSGGQQQMVAIASALVALPQFLLIDELSLGLAPAVVRRLVPVVREIAERGVGVMLVEQFAPVALDLATHAVVLDRGSVSFSGKPDKLIDEPELLHAAYLAGAASAQGG